MQNPEEDGQVDAHSPTALKDAGSAALKAGDLPRAIHLYTLGKLKATKANPPPKTLSSFFPYTHKYWLCCAVRALNGAAFRS